MSKVHEQSVRLVSWRKSFGQRTTSDPPYGGLKRIDRALVVYLMNRIRAGLEPVLLFSATVERGHLSIGLATPEDRSPNSTLWDSTDE